MNEPITRRQFVRQGTLLAAGAATPRRSRRKAGAAASKQPIRIGQIGIGHNHASAKMAAFRKLADHYEVRRRRRARPEWRKKGATTRPIRDTDLE